jgi:hypothetical protein
LELEKVFSQKPGCKAFNRNKVFWSERNTNLKSVGQEEAPGRFFKRPGFF